MRDPQCYNRGTSRKSWQNECAAHLGEEPGCQESLGLHHNHPRILSEPVVVQLQLLHEIRKFSLLLSPFRQHVSVITAPLSLLDDAIGRSGNWWESWHKTSMKHGIRIGLGLHALCVKISREKRDFVSYVVPKNSSAYDVYPLSSLWSRSWAWEEQQRAPARMRWFLRSCLCNVGPPRGARKLLNTRRCIRLNPAQSSVFTTAPWAAMELPAKQWGDHKIPMSTCVCVYVCVHEGKRDKDREGQCV